MTTTATHTPGPWTEGTRIPVYGVHGLALVMAAPAKELAVAKANGRLIAAAPDLLAALQKLSRPSEAGLCFCGPRKQNVGHTRACEDARAAIAKATGQDSTDSDSITLPAVPEAERTHGAG